MTWTDIDDIVLSLDEAHPGIDPMTVRFTELRKLVEGLDDFEADPDRRVNEQILEAIQSAWIEERQDAEDDASGASRGDDDSGRGDDSGGEGNSGGDRNYRPNNPFR